MTVTLREAAKATGSRVLHGRSHPVSDETKQQILASAKEPGYGLNLVGRSLRSARTNTLGLIVDNIASPFSPIVIRGNQDYLQQFNNFSTVINADFDPSDEARAVQE